MKCLELNMPFWCCWNREIRLKRIGTLYRALKTTTQTNCTQYTIPIRQFPKFNKKIQISNYYNCSRGGCTPSVENIVITVVLYIQWIILYFKITIQQYLEHWHVEAGLSRNPLRLGPLLSSKAPILSKPIASQLCLLNSKPNSHSGSY